MLAIVTCCKLAASHMKEQPSLKLTHSFTVILDQNIGWIGQLHGLHTKLNVLLINTELHVCLRDMLEQTQSEERKRLMHFSNPIYT